MTEWLYIRSLQPNSFIFSSGSGEKIFRDIDACNRAGDLIVINVAPVFPKTRGNGLRLSLRLYLLTTTTDEEQLSCLLAAAGGWRVGR